MKTSAHLCLVCLLSLGVTGCIFVDGEHVSREDWSRSQRDNREMISQLAINMQRSEVLEKLGTPADSEAFTHQEEEVRVLFYRTHWKHGDGETTRDETTPLVFKNDRLIGWGDTVYANALR
ncbi:MAG: DUF3192 domain-containing protein [Congregibacter sp.]